MRRRADSPLGPVTHDPQPSKRMRRESGASESRSPPRSANSYSRGEDTSPRVIRTASPSRPTLPPLNPLPLMQPGSTSSERGGSAGGSGSGAGSSGREPFQSFSAAGHAAQNPSSSNWQGRNWAGHRSRHSIDTPVVNLKSPSPPSATSGGSERPRKEERPTEGASSSSGGGASGGGAGGGTGGSTDVVFSRDVTNRQPRSMMACMRCRRQKMKCDGPGKEPCRGCRQAGVPCVFESRTRPKSISTLPSRASPFFVGSMPTGRGGTPGAAPGGPSFYPATAQAAPPITSRPTMVPDYVLRPGPGGREPMPPPPPQSAAYPPPLRAHTPPQLPSSAGGGHPQPPYYAGPPPGAPGYGAPPPTGPPPQIQPPPPPPQALESRIDSRLRGLETAFRSVSTLPAAVAGIQQSLNTLLRTQDALNAQLAGGSAPGSAGAGLNVATTNASAAALRAAADVPDHVWESYRVGAWPLTPWLPGISPLPGLPALLLACLGRRAVMDRTDATRREADAAADAVVAEVSRLLCARVQWTRDEVLSLGVYGTWTADPALACLAVGLARDLQLDRPHVLRRSHDEWREWIYVVLTDHMVHLPNFDVPMIHDPQSGHWRELVAESRPSDPSTLDRDSKLLAWLEYSELLIEVQQMQRAADPPSSPDRHSTEREGAASVTRDDEALERERQRCRDIWRRHASKWEAWASNSGARHDPVLSLHFNYAVLYTASPVFAASERVWAALAQSHEGYQQLERGRDAALAVLQTLGSPEIGRTLGYSFPVLRPFFGLAIAHLVSMVSTLSHLPLISLPHIQGQLRGVLDTLADAAPLDATRVPPASPRSPGHDTPLLPLSLLRDMVESGQVAAVGKRDIVGVEPCRDLWRRIVG